MLSPASCDLFNIPFFQFAQLKKYQPETIEPFKAEYKARWQVWQQLIQAVAADLGEPFAPPHIERWCNGWQVRAHFFAYFKYAQYQNSAAILSVLLNRRRLTVSLDWHCYKAGVSPIALPQYNQWLDGLDTQRYADWDMWHGSESEYADYARVGEQNDSQRILQNADDFFCIGKHIERDDLGKQDEERWIADSIRALTPLYEACFK
ncbi:glucose-6-phosphate 1-dehydrogenase family protein [Neisseria sp. ZJ106]|uniref:Glucose-6-phosphate 1-dehydrogenase family protein n=1 Tax=Neisseria lisongii TaxID=2912188 RepID=A0ABY7RJK0_9NEIS|nr:glucose-6-phosphate 1-dehydrogenase family protein [Neisseria lisongii]MCF7521224.1 glucose-6-phosphate 1-dehydrogenase family protein [Neisseria lisongii]WCL71716.1 glucose-6-phosphate 1-dehydrogenase family protein [Neisseria lisongii]